LISRYLDEEFVVFVGFDLDAKGSINPDNGNPLRFFHPRACMRLRHGRSFNAWIAALIPARLPSRRFQWPNVHEAGKPNSFFGRAELIRPLHVSLLTP
jgi:hypothetical protein